jgi:HAD superfamily hydrolase (TIGR01509 family)
LDAATKSALHRLLMTTHCADPAEMCATICEQLGLAERTVGLAIAEVWRAQENEACLIPGALAALQAFIARGYRLALLSNIWTPYLRSVRRLLGDFFDAHIPQELQLVSCREGLAKPAPQLFRRALERARVAPADALMIGDSYDNDIRPAAACGMRTLWLLQSPVREAPAVLRILNGGAVAPTLTIRSLADLDLENSMAGLFEVS